jgi:SET family sugar efflux transporter-like MFS transporter
LGIRRFVPDRPHPPHAHRRVHAPMREVLARPDIFISVIAFILVFAAHSINLMNLPLMVTEQLGGSERDVGIIFGIAPFVEMPLMLWSGQMAARGHMMALLRIGAGATVAYFLTLVLVHAPWHIYPMQILSAVSIAILTNITILFFQDLLPGQPGMATSLFSNAFNAGNLLGYFAFGMLVRPLGHRGLFLLCAALAAITTIILVFYRHRAVPRTGRMPEAAHLPLIS